MLVGHLNDSAMHVYIMSFTGTDKIQSAQTTGQALTYTCEDFLTCACRPHLYMHSLFLPHLCMHTLLGGSLRNFGISGLRGGVIIHGAWTHWMQQPRLSSLAHAFFTCSCNHFSALTCTCTHVEGVHFWDFGVSG